MKNICYYKWLTKVIYKWLTKNSPKPEVEEHPLSAVSWKSLTLDSIRTYITVFCVSALHQITQLIHCSLWKLKVHHRLHNIPTRDFILCKPYLISPRWFLILSSHVRSVLPKDVFLSSFSSDVFMHLWMQPSVLHAAPVSFCLTVFLCLVNYNMQHIKGKDFAASVVFWGNGSV
jgi:hypothetical protein